MHLTQGNSQHALAWRKLPQGWLAYDMRRDRAVAGFGQHFMRPWIYPLYTPSGQQVLQEFAFDHPFHNGCFIGWHPIRFENINHNFWATPPQRSFSDPMMENLGRVQQLSEPVLSEGKGFLEAFLSLAWNTASGLQLLAEQRTYRFRATELGNVVELHSHLCALEHQIELPSTKFAGIGVRVDPRLTAVGDAWFEGENARGDASLLHEKSSNFLRIEGQQGGRVLGLYIEAPGFRLPWFVRDYGLVLLNPVWHQGILLDPGMALEQSVRLFAYDALISPSTTALAKNLVQSD